MPKASRNERRKRQTKRTNTLLKFQLKGYEKAYQLEQAQKQNVVLVVSALLAQNGGEMTITQGTLNQVLENISTLGFQMVPGAVEGEWLVKLVTQEVEDNAPIEEVTAGSESEFDPPYLGGGIAGDGGGPAPVDPTLG